MFEIVRPIEPSKLQLLWQSSSSEHRSRYLVGEIVRVGSLSKLFYHRHTSDFFNAVERGYSGHPAFDLRHPVHEHNVTEVFAKRLPARQRNDFFMYLTKFGLQKFPEISDFALLGYTGGKLPGDGFSFEIDYRFEKTPLDTCIEIAGFRYYEGMHIEMEALMSFPIQFLHEVDNKHDRFAIKIIAGSTHIGYVPAAQSQMFFYWMHNVDVRGRIVGFEGPLSKPQVRLYIQVGDWHHFVRASKKNRYIR